jgi:uroporphyrinogen-III decarboxylase
MSQGEGMNDEQWKNLLGVLDGDVQVTPPCGFIVDSPWLPGWYGVEISEYLASETIWFEANRQILETFPDVWFLPGFWSEFGMCTEPSAFGARCIFPRNEFPFAEKVIHNVDQIADMKTPHPATDGLLPLMINRLKWARPRIEDLGHRIRFSVSRGPFNIASFLMGMTEFLMALKTRPALIHRLLRVITDFLKQWHDLQRSIFPSIDGILILDDIVGFVGAEDFVELALPYLRELYATDVAVRFFHNDAPCARSIQYYSEIGINLFNPGTQTLLTALRSLSHGRLTILGTIPPLDVLARGTPEDVRQAVRQLLEQTSDRSRLILSCAGGMPPGVTTENLRAFLDETKASSGSRTSLLSD